MTTYETDAVPGQLTPPAPLDPPVVHQLARHALDVLIPAATGPRDQAEPLGEAAGQLALALRAFARLVEADADDQLTEGEGVVERLRRASLHVHEHLAAKVPAVELEARNLGLVDSNLEEGLPVVGSMSAELNDAGEALIQQLSSVEPLDQGLAGVRYQRAARQRSCGGRTAYPRNLAQHC
ncbi:hypothetical protein ACRWOO_11425 [Streptomyces sp. NEAU-PBA10]|uniref:hypothetical protein n=1 Tax=Streptomyces sp. NEAU-PBA10 TaxID=3438640 RepID=UPI003F7A53B4